MGKPSSPRTKYLTSYWDNCKIGDEGYKNISKFEGKCLAELGLCWSNLI